MGVAVTWITRGLACVAALLMTGCPIFPSGVLACGDDFDCARGYVCDLDEGECVLAPEPIDCNIPADCDFGYTCGSDDQCHAAACDRVGCPAGWTCVAEEGVLFCQGDRR